MSDYDFSEKVLVLTGASGGIGLATAEYFFECGASIAATYNENLAITELANALDARAKRFFVMQVDVAESESCLRFANECKERFGNIDFLVNNAAVLRMASVQNMTDALWREVMGSNLDSVFYICRSFLPVINNGGSIVNIASAAAHRGAVDHSAYAASKAAVLAFSRSLAQEVAPDIRCNAISPGMIDTKMLDVLPNDILQSLKDESPFNRLGKPTEIAEAIGFLCSERSSFVTAETLHVNGAGYIAS